MLKDKELRKTIGSRAKSRRQELGLNQPYVAEKMGVTASTIQRYEAGTIDNTKKMTLEGLADALHVSVEWLKVSSPTAGIPEGGYKMFLQMLSKRSSVQSCCRNR